MSPASIALKSTVGMDGTEAPPMPFVTIGVSHQSLILTPAIARDLANRLNNCAREADDLAATLRADRAKALLYASPPQGAA